MITWGEYLTYGVLDTLFLDGNIEAPPKFSTIMYPKGINAEFYNVDNLPAEEVVTKFKNRFEVPETRDIALCAEQIVNLLGKYGSLKDGSFVIDFGAGTGLLLNHLSAIVGVSGCVIASELSEILFSHLLQRVSEESLKNVSVVKGTGSNPNLEEFAGTCDCIVICDVYHHLEYPRTTIRHLRKALKPTGKLVVIDFIRDEKVHHSHPPGWISQHVRASQHVFRKEIMSCGFRSVAEPSIPQMDENYIMVFEPVELLFPGSGWAN